jgi:hypothetical protein
MRRLAGLLMSAAALTCGAGARVSAQESISVGADVLFYGDNTEFRNPFREGETIFGAAARVVLDADLTSKATLTLGVFGNQRFGSEDAFEQVRPVLALTVRGKRSSFTFGALPASRHTAAAGPDLNGPHGLLPPLQRETLSFDRPYEAGLQWRFEGATLRHEMWLDWQRINTRDHRERLDGGVQGEVEFGGAFALPFQLHVVHEGGQLFRSGPVADSIGAALGGTLRGRAFALERASIEAYVLASRFVPNRAQPERSRSGAAFLGRLAGERAGWRGHVLFWRGDDFIKDEGDPNYQSIRRDGTRYRGVRDYAEAGLTRLFRPAPKLTIHVSGRLHRVEGRYEYSYRILAVTALRWELTAKEARRSLEER